MADEGFTWLEYPETGGRNAFPDASVEAWKARGWVESEPPPEPDLYHDPGVVDANGNVIDTTALSDATPEGKPDNSTVADQPDTADQPASETEE